MYQADFADAQGAAAAPGVGEGAGAVLTSKSATVPGWQVIERSDWLVQGSSRQSPDAARQDAMGHALRIGANALVEMEYHKSTGSEPGTGSGVHRFTVHHWRGRAVNLVGPGAGIQTNQGGGRGINVQAQDYERQLQDAALVARQKMWWKYALVIGAFLLLMGIDKSGTVRAMAPLAIVVTAAMLLIGWLNKRRGYIDDGIEHPLFYSPAAPAQPDAARRTQPGRRSHQRRVGRAFVVDEAKLAAATHPLSAEYHAWLSAHPGKNMGFQEWLGKHGRKSQEDDWPLLHSCRSNWTPFGYEPNSAYCNDWLNRHDDD